MTFVTRRMFLGTASAAAALLPSTSAHAQRPALRLTCANYVRFMPLATGDLKPVDLDLTWIRGDRNEMLRRATADPQVDGGESSMAQHVVRIDNADRSLVAVPVFPLRNFTARDLYTRKGSTLSPAKLSGKRIGIYSWAASGAVWYRHLVRHLGNDFAQHPLDRSAASTRPVCPRRSRRSRPTSPRRPKTSRSATCCSQGTSTRSLRRCRRSCTPRRTDRSCG